MSKFSATKLSEGHHKLLEGIVKYLRVTKHWGIKYRCSVNPNDLDPTALVSDLVLDKNLPPFPVDINQPKLPCK